MAKSKDDDDSESDLQEKFEEEIKKPYYQVDYLDNFKLPYEKLDVSVIIPTYNRCPHKPGTLKESYNPLTWGIKTALMQKPKIKEIIIADDRSEDYTEQLVKKYQRYAKENDLPQIKYIKIGKRQGISAIRNLGASLAKGKYLFFIDDDSFISPYSAFGGVYTFEELEKKERKVGAINLPTYGRKSIPERFLPRKEIGILDFLNGIHKANKDAFVQEYLFSETNDKFLNQELQILNPIQIMNLNAIAIVPKRIFEEIGGFPEHILKRMEDREFGCRIVENGYHLYYQSDPKFHCVHGSYGLSINKKFEGYDWFKKKDKSISLKKAMEICDNPKENTGARINSSDFVYDYILAFFCLIYERNKKGALRWVKKVYREFVNEGKTGLFGNENIPIPSKEERKKMWLSAINQGLEFMKEKERKSIQKINDTLKKMKKEPEINEESLKILDKLEERW